MRLSLEQLAGHLTRVRDDPGRTLAPIYLVSSDEPLQSSEALDAVRAAARDLGFTGRVVLHVDASFDWGTFEQHADSLSLFGERQMLELRMPSGKPGAAGAAALVRYAERPSPDNVLLISTGRLDAEAARSRWYRALDHAGAVVPVWPIRAPQLPAWIGRRMAAAGLKPTSEAVEALAERVEGNLLACVQEIAKLRILHGEGPVDADDVYAAVADSARFEVFDLIDSALGGQAARTVRITRTLHEEGVEPLPVLGTLAWTIRSLAEMASELANGATPDRLFQRQPVWRRRRRVVEEALRRHEPALWWRLLREAARVDRVIKGGTGDPWDALERLALGVAGVMILPATPV
ncbi:MAG: DNA polymerase III subunit delta [Gammaproteobacteria bacterium]|nr:DNA polymerase III subunit delta [Gammaproteobacteria bacterium]NIR83675.1 DNA polymerase III subunit delta [Gammaproteobacteria bacterium]NIR91650.1 DNA polymerase III subunit delta [Gammaproteobacteria bacterium]NIU04837.1 DNA polymerase III subunit delta [Gammaproteobacteria bacterium]NIV51823.1 DNA polymerase III subunit delta [Gammaproteobacteria bacterium]